MCIIYSIYIYIIYIFTIIKLVCRICPSAGHSQCQCCLAYVILLPDVEGNPSKLLVLHGASCVEELDLNGDASKRCGFQIREIPKRNMGSANDSVILRVDTWINVKSQNIENHVNAKAPKTTCLRQLTT